MVVDRKENLAKVLELLMENRNKEARKLLQEILVKSRNEILNESKRSHESR